MSDGTEICIEHRATGKGCQAHVTVTSPGRAPFVDTVDTASAKDRDGFVKRACAECPGLPEADIRDRLSTIAAEILSASDSSDGSDSSAGKISHATLIVQLAGDLELFHTPGGHDAEGYAVIKYEDHREVLHLGSKGFKNWLSRRFYEAYETAPGSQAVTDAINVILGRALYEGDEQEVAIRVARGPDGIYIDLADEEWRVVRVRPTGWDVIPNTEAPVNFVRKRGMLALPVPVRGGSIEELRPLVNIPDDGQWILYRAYLVIALRPEGPYLILLIEGEQGSAKTTTARRGRALIDPHVSDLRSPPGTPRDLMISASNAWVQGYDNISGLSRGLSDALCSLATGGALSTREYYTDGDEKHFAAMRPCLMNGIDNGGARPDLLDRSICLSLPRIPRGTRRPEAELKAEFERVRPRVFGALLDALVCAEKNIDRVRLDAYPRMADAAAWGVAASSALGFTEEEFLAEFDRNREEADRVVVENSAIGPAILRLAENGRWTGTATGLLSALSGPEYDDLRVSKDWPKTPEAMSHALRRLAPGLRAIGVEVSVGEREPSRSRARLTTIYMLPGKPSEPSEPSDTTPVGPAEQGGDGQFADSSPDQGGWDGPSAGVASSCASDSSDGSDSLSGDFLDEGGDLYWEAAPPAGDDDSSPDAEEEDRG